MNQTREETETELVEQRNILLAYIKDMQKMVDDINDELTELRV